MKTSFRMSHMVSASAELSFTVDFYGNRIATCSSDQKINILNYDSRTRTWHPSSSWTAHDASVLQVIFFLLCFLLMEGELGTSSTRPSHRVVFIRPNSQNMAGTGKW